MTKKKINWSNIYIKFIAALILAGFICFVIWDVKTEEREDFLLKNDYVYTIGCFDKTKSIKTRIEYYFTVIYKDSIYFNDINAQEKQDRSIIREVLYNSYPGDRFLVKLSPEDPSDASVILVDYPIPLDIAKAPSEGWKEIPDWDQERAKGNILDLPYDGSKYVKYVYLPNNNHIYFALIMLLLLLPLYHRQIWAFLKEIKQKW